MQKATTTQQVPGKSAADSGESRPCDVEAHLSKEGKARNLSSLSEFIFRFSGIPGMVSLHGGLPNASIFPFKSMKVELGDGTWLDMSGKDKVTQPDTYLCVTKHLPVGALQSPAHCNPLISTLNSACMCIFSLYSAQTWEH